MKTKEFQIVAPGRIELWERDLDTALKPHEAVVRTEYSIVSAGTEGATFTGLVNEMPFREKQKYPTRTGYGNLGTVLEVGPGVTMCKPGDRVLSFSCHGSVVIADEGRMALPVGSDKPGQTMVAARMCGVSIAALRSSSVQSGDTVLVVGMGLVGNFAAQLFRLAGAEVMAADLSDYRLEKARECGISRTVNAKRENLREAVMGWTGGKGAQVVVEAIGKSDVISEAVLLTRTLGEFILLGSPRARATLDVTPMLLHIHLQDIRLIGALEWVWPMHETLRARNIVENYRQILRWIADGRIIVEPLITHVASPADCQTIYSGLTSEQEEYLGAVFDWSRV